jgi:transcriptional regulator with XRE-family HTH domain
MSSQLDFGTWLAGRRRKAGITQRDLAKKTGLSAGYLALLERGTSEPPPLKTCKRLAAALGLDWNEVRPVSLATRLKTWLKREGYSGIPEAELLELARRIESAGRERSR